ncbi:WD-40 repeat protein [Halomicronema hongdechloris C2206]|uniref:WD-40 repeat protein n=1 Tax=Halomicronema hongdechloris C2206 TaxID=1641165 RepID=A0A1Z3HKK7_9CYAN|nr:AAA family ATPase [Halomicronema hongdechloris]ASC70627.1 WD-40 repeat protein [Halomicronema hongdechloris C2206]
MQELNDAFGISFQEALSTADAAVFRRFGKHLSTVEQIVLRGTWDQQTYEAMAEATAGYSDEYLKKDVGPKLWRKLTQALGESVGKRNVKAVLSRLTNGSNGASPAVEPTANSNGREMASPPLAVPPPGELRLDVSDFCGRTALVRELGRWITEQGRLMVLWGRLGVGKTLLAMKLREQVEAAFDTHIYLPLASPLAPEDFLDQLLRRLGIGDEGLQDWSQRLTCLMQALYHCRALILVDNAECLCHPSQLAGDYRPGYGRYRDLLHQLATILHRSCVIWISQEEPKEMRVLEGQKVRSHCLHGLTPADAITLLTRQSALKGDAADWTELVHRYDGIPLFLKDLTTTIEGLYEGRLEWFLGQPLLLTDRIRNLLQRQWHRLSPPEQEVMYWLALASAPVALEELQADLIGRNPSQLVALIESLQQRALCQRLETADASMALGLSPVVRVYVQQQFIQQVQAELLSHQLRLFHSHRLLQVTAADPIQARQRQEILIPLAEALREAWSDTLVDQIKSLQVLIHRQFQGQEGYSSGNLINLCHQLEIGLAGSDFSDLAIWHADLQTVSLFGSNFTGANFQASVFAKALGRELVLAFSPDNCHLATGDHEGQLLLWRVDDGSLDRVLVIQRESQATRALTFSPDGTTLAEGSADGRLWLWSLGNGYGADDLCSHTAAISALAFSGDGRYLASGDVTGCILIWELASGRSLQTLQGHQGAIQRLRFSNDGQWLVSSGEDHTAQCWQLTTGERRQGVQGRGIAQIKDVQFLDEVPEPSHPPSAIALGLEEHNLIVWDLSTGRPRWVVPSEADFTAVMALSGDGETVAHSRHNGSIELWAVAHQQRRYCLRDPNTLVTTLAFSQDGALLATAGDHRVNLWALSTGAGLRTLYCQRQPVNCFQVSSDGQWLTTGHRDQGIRLWQMATGQFAVQFQPGVSQARPVQVMTANRDWLASGGEDHAVRLWSIDRPDACQSWLDHDAPVTALSLSPQGRWLVSGGEDARLQVRSLDAQQPSYPLLGHTRAISALAISADDRWLASGSRDRTVRLWNLETASGVITLKGHHRRVQSLTFSPDGQHLLSGSPDGVVRLWQVDSGACLQVWMPPGGLLHGVLFDRQGAPLAITSDDAVLQLWLLPSATLYQRLTGHRQAIWQVSLSSDGHYLASASQDDEIRIWDLWLGSCQQTLRPDRPYEGMTLRDSQGLSEAERLMLRALGAVDSPNSPKGT